MLESIIYNSKQVILYNPKISQSQYLKQLQLRIIVIIKRK